MAFKMPKVFLSLIRPVCHGRARSTVVNDPALQRSEIASLRGTGWNNYVASASKTALPNNQLILQCLPGDPHG